MLPTLMLVANLARGHAVAPPDFAPDGLPFGLDRLQWGINAREAKRKYPLLDGIPAEPGQLSATLILADHAIAGCRFTVSLNFELGLLDRVDVDSNGTAHLNDCAGKIKPALARRYGRDPGGFSTEKNPHGYSAYASWGGPVSEIVYAELKDGFITMRFSPTPGHR